MTPSTQPAAAPARQEDSLGRNRCRTGGQRADIRPKSTPHHKPRTAHDITEDILNEIDHAKKGELVRELAILLEAERVE